MFQYTSEFRQEPSSLLSPARAEIGDKVDHSPPVSAVALQHLTSVAQEFDELANTCLLLLHLEVLFYFFV